MFAKFKLSTLYRIPYSSIDVHNSERSPLFKMASMLTLCSPIEFTILVSLGPNSFSKFFERSLNVC